MILGIDIDDVLFDWSKLAHAACERAGITNGAQITRWAFHEDYGCTVETLWRVLGDAYFDGMLLAPPREGVCDVLSDLQDMGHEIHLVTARGSERGLLADLVVSDTADWLTLYDVPHDRITFTTDKTEVPTDMFIDDSVKNVAALRLHGVDAYLHTQPHNTTAEVDLPRVNSLEEFASLVSTVHKASAIV